MRVRIVGNSPKVLTYVLAILAACANAASSVLQRKASRSLPSEDSLRPRLILKLLRRPIWFAGVAGVIAGFLLQAAALGNGELSVVQPLLVLELPLTLVLASRVFHRSLRAREWTATLGMTAGLAGLLYCLAPSAGRPQAVPWWLWLLASAVNLAVVGLAVEFGRRAGQDPEAESGSARRAAAFGVATGSVFGLTAALIKGMTERFSHGFVALLTGWQLYALIVAGALGMFLLQSALHAGRLIAAQPGMTLSDPIVSVAWGVFVFGEQVRGGWYLALAFVGGGLIAVSVVVLARSPLLEDHGGDSVSGRPGTGAVRDGPAGSRPG
jgi:drug/metabolite transporter (DMT)-like permease